MVKRRWKRLWSRVAGVAALVGWGWGATASAAPTVAQVLQFKPRQQGVEPTTPNLKEQEDCTVKLIREGKGSGWLLSSPTQKLRRFYDTNADNRIDIWSYYKDGAEIYREVDTNYNGKPDQYRWLNLGGQKWGVDQNEDGQIDGWNAISPEEVSQEIVLAINTRSYEKLQALMLTSTEMEALDLLPAEKEKITASLGKAQATFRETLTKLKDVDKAKWLHLETGAPQCRPADPVNGSRVDLVSHPRGAILYDVNGNNDWLQTGMMVQVGKAWRLVAAPVPGHSVDQAPTTASGGAQPNEKLQKLLADLSDHDKTMPEVEPTPGPKPLVVKHNLARADILEKIVAEVEPREREAWIRQVADSLSTAAQNSGSSEKTALTRLESLRAQIVKVMSGSNLAAYIEFRRMQAIYARQLTDPKGDFTKIQENWLKTLASFVKEYPKAPDSADALLQLGMVSEFLAKESEAKKWYEQLASDFASHDLAGKAKGALNRLGAVGKQLQLSGRTLSGDRFSIEDLSAKLTVVYYWASWNQQTVGDFAKMKLMLSKYEDKGVKMVCVNLDNEASEAKAFLEKTSSPTAVHLFEKGGLESRFASEYGIMVLPHLFLVGGNGKVISRTVQVSNLEDAIQRSLDLKSKKN